MAYVDTCTLASVFLFVIPVFGRKRFVSACRGPSSAFEASLLVGTRGVVSKF